MSFMGLLNTTCTIRRFTSTGTDADGHPSGTWGDNATGVACRLAPNTGKLEGREYRVGTQVRISSHKLYLFSGADITHEDRVVIGTPTYVVLGVKDPAGAGHHQQADVELIE